MTAALYGIFFVSGLASLLFETLWFRQAGLVFGNTVWATSITTGSFMAGLALGSGLVARHGGRLRRPLMAYAALEATVAMSGLALVVAFPMLVAALAPVLRVFVGTPLLLNAVRMALAFLLLLVPATAMGATLPIVARVLAGSEADFGRILGRLYGVNTIGAMAGALLGETWLIGRLGVRGTGVAAALLDVAAAVAALALARRLSAPAIDQTALSFAVPPAARGLLAAAFACGAILLALEVVWFRFLLLFMEGTSPVFAVLLAVVLGGIALGGLGASAWLRRNPDAHRHVPAVALVAGAACVFSYAAFSGALGAFHRTLMSGAGEVGGFAARLMLPTCIVSGALFPLLGKRLREHVPSEGRTTGWLTLANTMGGVAGALAGGFVLLPRLGVERSLFLLAAAYLLVAALAGGGPRSETWKRRDLRWGLGVSGLAFVAAVALFPHGLMRNHFVPQATARWRGDQARIVAVREGLTETAVYLRKDFLGEPLYYRLVTNSMSMASTHFASRRYMGLFAWWPLALHPRAEDALLISYGVGTTARTLLQPETVRRLDIVDPSADVLQMSRMAISGAHPLDDPRVHVHLEDGRFFLTTTERRYDVITSEPPPPKEVVSLYTREYFELLRSRLKPGGLATYWLPVAILEPSDFRSIVRAFCDAFADCALWTGFGAEWMLTGSGGAFVPASDAEVARLWTSPRSAPALREAGVEMPEQLGALFIADAPELARIVAGSEAVDDDHPYRLSAKPAMVVRAEYYSSIASTAENQRRFAASPTVRAYWPPALRERTIPFFAPQAAINRRGWAAYGAGKVGIEDARILLFESPLRTPVSWMLDSSDAEQAIAARALASGNRSAEALEHVGIGLLAARRFPEASAAFAESLAAGGEAARLATLRALADEGARTTPAPAP